MVMEAGCPGYEPCPGFQITLNCHAACAWL